MRTSFLAAIAAFVALGIAPSAFARERSHVFGHERSLAATLSYNWSPTVLVFTHGGASPNQIREYEAVLAERPYRRAYVLIVDVDADPVAARCQPTVGAPSFTVMRARGDHFRAEEGSLSAAALRRELDAALAAPVGRASVD